MLALALGARCLRGKADFERLLAVVEGWIGGPGAIQRLMRRLFGDARTTSPSHLDAAAVIEPHAFARRGSPSSSTTARSAAARHRELPPGRGALAIPIAQLENCA